MNSKKISKFQLVFILILFSAVILIAVFFQRNNIDLNYDSDVRYYAIHDDTLPKLK